MVSQGNVHNLLILWSYVSLCLGQDRSYLSITYLAHSIILLTFGYGSSLHRLLQYTVFCKQEKKNILLHFLFSHTICTSFSPDYKFGIFRTFTGHSFPGTFRKLKFLTEHGLQANYIREVISCQRLAEANPSTSVPHRLRIHCVSNLIRIQQSYCNPSSSALCKQDGGFL